MRTLRNLTVFAGVVVAVILSAPLPATAATITYVEDHTGWAWPVRSSQDWVDQYTSSDIRYGACRSGYRCVRVWERTIRSEWAAVTYIDSPTRVRIYVNPQRTRYPYAARRSIVTHELGHAFGIIVHSSACTDVMYARVFCAGGGVPPYRFSAAQRDILRRH